MPCKKFLLIIGGVEDGIPQEGIYKFIVEKEVDEKKNMDGCGSWMPVWDDTSILLRHLRAMVLHCLLPAALC